MPWDWDSLITVGTFSIIAGMKVHTGNTLFCSGKLLIIINCHLFNYIMPASQKATTLYFSTRCSNYCISIIFYEIISLLSTAVSVFDLTASMCGV